MNTNALAAGFTDALTKLGENIIGFFTGFTVAYGVEIVLFYLLIYYVSKVLRDNDATRLMLLYWGLIVVMGAMKYAVELFDTQFYFYFVLILSMFMLVMFNVEVKKSLWDIHSPAKEKIEKLVNGTEARSQADVEHCISDIIKALQNMSKNNVGALIVLSKGNLPKQVIQSGVRLDAEISTQLIEGIFFPKAPLHDGIPQIGPRIGGIAGEIHAFGGEGQFGRRRGGERIAGAGQRNGRAPDLSGQDDVGQTPG